MARTSRKSLHDKAVALLKTELSGDNTRDALVFYDVACASLQMAAEAAVEASLKEGRKYQFKTVVLMLTTDAYQRVVATQRAMNRKNRKK